MNQELFNSGRGGDDGNNTHHDSDDGGGGLQGSNSLHSYNRSMDSIHSYIRDSRDDVRIRAFRFYNAYFLRTVE